jgi:tubulin polyglutamylase TTLL6/13
MLAKMKTGQKINHFPGMYEISKKNHLAKNLNQIREAFPEDYDFYPKTWILPQDLYQLKSALNDKNTLIIKPDASSQGKGIYLANNIEDVKCINNCIAQKYITNPLLIDGLKFDLRIYVGIIGCDPLRIYIHEDGLVRFATELYKPPSGENLNERFMHLTNYAVNKFSDKFVQNNDVDSEKSHKRSLSSVLKVNCN